MSARDGDTGPGLSAQAGHTALTRALLIPETGLTPAAVLLDEGRALTGDWGVGECASLRQYDVASEADYKRASIAEGRLMQHALLGLREQRLTRAAWREVYERCGAAGVRVERFGVCLERSMGYRRADRGAAIA